MFSQKGGTEHSDSSAPFRTYEQIFDEIFPYYLSIGMTYEQFWEQDCGLVKAYWEAEQLREERENRHAHLQGLYIYEALCCVSPVLNAFAKKGTKPIPYRSEPYAITKHEMKKSEQSKKEQTCENAAKSFEAFVAGFNNKFKEKKAKE